MNNLPNGLKVFGEELTRNWLRVPSLAFRDYSLRVA